jgi:hypothetical protein
MLKIFYVLASIYVDYRKLQNKPSMMEGNDTQGDKRFKCRIPLLQEQGVISRKE